MSHSPWLPLLSALRCPICHREVTLTENGKSLVCLPAGEGENPFRKIHCFDLSKNGYVHFDAAHHDGGDAKEAVRARTAFLSTGAYRLVAEAIAHLLRRYEIGRAGEKSEADLVIDAGCGEGYYTRLVAGCLTWANLLGFDLSKSAIESASKQEKTRKNIGESIIGNAVFAVGGIFDLPVKDHMASALLSIFAPVAEAEFSRVLKEDGILIVASAGENHLMGLKRAVYQTPYPNTPRADLPVSMTLVEEQSVSYKILLKTREEILSLFAMTPYRFRTSKGDYEKLQALETLETEVDVVLSVYRNRIS